VRVFGHSEGTRTGWLTHAGAHSHTLPTHWFHKVHVRHVQLDELRTRLRSRADVLWRWVALDPVSKLIPVLRAGARTQDAAHRPIHDRHRRLTPGCIPFSPAMA
jgi:hypothetical protein